MGNCMSVGAIEVSDEDKRRHREVEKSLKQVRIQCSGLFTGHICHALSSAHVRFMLTTLSYQAKQKLASQVKVCGGSFLLERRRQTVS
jgi:hypothetical protein